MKTPKTLIEWLADVKEAYASAESRFESGQLDIQSMTESFRCAAPIAASRRGIVDSVVIAEMAKYVVDQMEEDVRNGTELSEYKFNFVISYIHAHTPAGIINEMTADRVTEYVNDEWDLFFDNDVWGEDDE